MPNGLTLHRLFRLGRSSNTQKSSFLRDLSSDDLADLRALVGDNPIIIIDEYSLLYLDFLGKIDARLFQITGRHMIDHRVLFIGDNFQLPPVANVDGCLYKPLKPHANQYEYAGKACFDSCTHLHLTQIMRSGEDLTHCRNTHQLSNPDSINPITPEILSSCHNLSAQCIQSDPSWAWATAICASNREVSYFRMILSDNYCKFNGQRRILWHSKLIGLQNQNTLDYLAKNPLEEGIEVFVPGYMCFIIGNTYLHLKVIRNLVYSSY